MEYSPLIPRETDSPNGNKEDDLLLKSSNFQFQDVDFDEIKKFPLDADDEEIEAESSSVVIPVDSNNQKNEKNKSAKLFGRRSIPKSKSISEDISPTFNEKQSWRNSKCSSNMTQQGEGTPTVNQPKKSSPIEIKNSPGKIRDGNNKSGSGGGSSSRISFFKVLTRRNSTANQGKHKKLEDHWLEAPEPVMDGVTFCIKFLGSTLIEKSGASDAAEATKTVIQMVKAGHKPTRLGLTVCTNGITLSDPSTGEIRLEISIYDIAHCSADANYPNVFSFIATNKNDVNECYCFATRKRKMAQHITLTIAQAFNLAFELWQTSSMENSSDDPNYSSSLVSNDGDVKVIIGSTDSAKSNASTGSTVGGRGSGSLGGVNSVNHRQWVHFDQEEQEVDHITSRLNSINMVTLSPFHRIQNNNSGNTSSNSQTRRNRKDQHKNEDLLIFLN